jgi:hypothetical protein
MKIVFGVLFLVAAIICAYFWWYAPWKERWLWLAAEFVFGDRAFREFGAPRREER